jgi:uncharacterized protein YbjT (DUF2867 family)
VTVLVTGASGYIGSRLVRELVKLGEPVGAVVRDPRRASLDPAVAVYRADLLERDSLRAIEGDFSTAYYLVHSMGRGGNSGYEQRDVTAASNFARFAPASTASSISADSVIAPDLRTCARVSASARYCASRDRR